MTPPSKLSAIAVFVIASIFWLSFEATASPYKFIALRGMNPPTQIEFSLRARETGTGVGVLGGKTNAIDGDLDADVVGILSPQVTLNPISYDYAATEKSGVVHNTTIEVLLRLDSARISYERTGAPLSENDDSPVFASSFISGSLEIDGIVHSFDFDVDVEDQDSNCDFNYAIILPILIPSTSGASSTHCRWSLLTLMTIASQDGLIYDLTVENVVNSADFEPVPEPGREAQMIIALVAIFALGERRRRIPMRHGFSGIVPKPMTLGGVESRWAG